MPLVLVRMPALFVQMDTIWSKKMLPPQEHAKNVAAIARLVETIPQFVLHAMPASNSKDQAVFQMTVSQ